MILILKRASLRVKLHKILAQMTVTTKFQHYYSKSWVHFHHHAIGTWILRFLAATHWLKWNVFSCWKKEVNITQKTLFEFGTKISLHFYWIFAGTVLHGWIDLSCICIRIVPSERRTNINEKFRCMVTLKGKKRPVVISCLRGDASVSWSEWSGVFQQVKEGEHGPKIV